MIFLKALSVVPLLLQCLILRRVQTFMNPLDDHPDGSRNSGFTVSNKLWMFIGVIYWGVGLPIAIDMNSVLQ